MQSKLRFQLSLVQFVRCVRA